jgi:hypothetical protein
MKRTDADEHILNEFQDESLPTTAGTLINASYLNANQAEICNAVEIHDSVDQAQGQSPLNHQLANVILNNRTQGIFGDDAHWRETSGGLIPQVPGSGLQASMTAGAVYLNGRRVEFTADRLADFGHSAYTYTASKDTYVQIHQDGPAHTSNPIMYAEVANGAAAPTPSANYENTAVVVTDATDVTAVNDLFTTSPLVHLLWKFWNGLQVLGVNYTDAPLVSTHQGSVSGDFDNDVLLGPFTVHAKTASTSAVDTSLGYTVPTGRSAMFIVKAHGHHTADPDECYSYKCEMYFRNTSGSTVGSSTIDNETAKQFLTSAWTAAPTLTLGGTDTPRYTFHASESTEYSHAITVWVRIMTHTDT